MTRINAARSDDDSERIIGVFYVQICEGVLKIEDQLRF